MTDEIAELRKSLGDRFAIERVLGRGGMGAVYLARDRQLDRPVALKVLPNEFAAQHDLRERFLRETRTAASFSHPNIVPLFSIEAHENVLAYAMGYVEGESLAEQVARSGPLPVREVVRLLQDVAYALAYAHGRGVIHRDIKPDNIMIERATGRALLMDFGISRSVQAAPLPGATRAGLTRVGEVVGTPEFMSPEQAAGDHLDGRSDLYSLGLVAWFALSGQSAMSGESTQKVLVKQLTEAVPNIQTLRTDVPALLADVVDRCVQKSPDDRFASAEALVDALDVSALRGVEVPLPVRLFAQELGQAGLVFAFSVIMLPLLYSFLSRTYEGDLDVLLPLVLFAAIVWGRMAQTVHQARTLMGRGFGVAEIQHGFAALLDERRAERAQLRADPRVVRRRRRHELFWVGMLGVSFLLYYWVKETMRTEVRPGWFTVSRPGVIIIYSAIVIRGLSVVNLLRSPLRANLGERFFQWVWASPVGALVLTVLGAGVRRAGTSRTVPPTRPVTAPTTLPVTSAPAAIDGTGMPRTLSPASPMNGHAHGTPTLEARVAALEAWRDRLDITATH
jgi:serine/threonine-protein kinase